MNVGEGSGEDVAYTEAFACRAPRNLPRGESSRSGLHLDLDMDAGRKKAPKVSSAYEPVFEPPPIGAEPYASVTPEKPDMFASGPSKNVGDKPLMRSVPGGTRHRKVLGICAASIL